MLFEHYHWFALIEFKIDRLAHYLCYSNLTPFHEYCTYCLLFIHLVTWMFPDRWRVPEYYCGRPMWYHEATNCCSWTHFAGIYSTLMHVAYSVNFRHNLRFWLSGCWPVFQHHRLTPWVSSRPCSLCMFILYFVIIPAWSSYRKYLDSVSI
jgi:hypothetical protein